MRRKLINIKNIIKNILYASSKEDALYREEAEKVYNSILKLLGNKSLRDKYLMPFYNLKLDEWGSSSDPPDGFSFNITHIPEFNNIDTKGRNLDISFGMVGKGNYGGYYTPHKKAPGITINMLVEKDITSKDVGRIIRKKFKGEKNVFIHEYIHFLDDIRFGVSREYKYEDIDTILYYSNPVEFNAHFQASIKEWEDILENIKIYRQIEILGQDKKDIVKAILQRFIFKKFDKKYRKKLISRVFKYVDDRIGDLYKVKLKELNSGKGFNRLKKDVDEEIELAKKYKGLEWINSSDLNKFSELQGISKIRQYLNPKFSEKLDQYLVDEYLMKI